MSKLHALPLLLLLTAVFPVAAKPADPAKPNILIIYADDLGYGDVQCYNPQRGRIPTPNIDRLAGQGIRFSDGHSASGVCSPSRYALLTGRYPWRTRLQKGIVNVFGEPVIAPERLTIGGLAKRHGYRTAAIGKWHLGWSWEISKEQRPFLAPPPRQKEGETPTPTPETLRVWEKVFSKRIGGGPTTLGFDGYFGTDIPNWPPFCFIANDHTVGVPSAYLSADQVKARTLGFPQGPALQGWRLEEILPTLGDKAVAFLDEAARRPEPFLLYLALTTPHTPLAVNKPWRGRSGLNDYADLVMETDAFVGRILDALDNCGAAGSTLVVFTSDNGCATYIGVKDLEKKGHFPSGNLRGYKGSAFEGGHRVPFIVRWPGVVRPGQICNQLVQQADLMATFADILSAKLPDEAGEDSISLLPLLKGENSPVRESAVNISIQGVPAVRDGAWKLILGSVYVGKSESGGEHPELQLYNLAEDAGETSNLAAQHPQRVAQMRLMMERFVTDGRSTPGAPQKNDVEVQRHPLTAR